MPIRILIVDDHSVVRQGLRMFLESDPDMEVVGEAKNGQEALPLVESLQPDVVLMDVLMPKMDGLAATLELRQRFPDTEVLILTSVLDEATITKAVRNGAIGYLLKDTQADDLCQAVRQASQGQTQMSPEVTARLVSELNHSQPGLDELTPREVEVLQAIASGASNREIADRLFIAEKTVKAHVSNLLAKMSLQSRTQAALLAVQKGWFEPRGG